MSELLKNKQLEAASASVLIGRGDSGAGPRQEIALGTGLSMSGNTLNASGLTLITQTTNYTVLVTDNIVLMDSTSGNLIVTLPTAASFGSNKVLRIKKIVNSNKIDINPNGSETIDGDTSVTLLGGGFPLPGLTLISDLSNWFVV